MKQGRKEMRVMSRVNWPEVRRSIRKHWLTAIITAFIVVIVFIFAGYRFDWTGFNGYNKVTIVHILSGANAGTVTRTEEYQPGKTLWDWLQLLIIPVMIAIGGFWLNQLQKSREEKHALMLELDKQHIASLQEYLANMSAMLKEKQLRESGEDNEVRNIARIRTLTVLSRLDSEHKRSVLQFLYEARLIQKDKKIIDLRGADFSEVDFFGAKLRAVDLSGAIFNRASFFEADLSEANLSGASFSFAQLSGGNFSGANFSGADLLFAHLTGATLTGAIFTGAAYVKENLNKAISFNENMNELQKWADQYNSKISGDD